MVKIVRIKKVQIGQMKKKPKRFNFNFQIPTSRDMDRLLVQVLAENSEEPIPVHAANYSQQPGSIQEHSLLLNIRIPAREQTQN